MYFWIKTHSYVNYQGRLQHHVGSWSPNDVLSPSSIHINTRDIHPHLALHHLTSHHLSLIPIGSYSSDWKDFSLSYEAQVVISDWAELQENCKFVVGKWPALIRVKLTSFDFGFWCKILNFCRPHWRTHKLRNSKQFDWRWLSSLTVENCKLWQQTFTLHWPSLTKVLGVVSTDPWTAKEAALTRHWPN